MSDEKKAVGFSPWEIALYEAVYSGVLGVSDEVREEWLLRLADRGVIRRLDKDKPDLGWMPTSEDLELEDAAPDYELTVGFAWHF